MNLGYTIRRVESNLKKFKTSRDEAKAKAAQIDKYWEGTAYNSFEDSYRDIDRVMQDICTGYSKIASRLSRLQIEITREEERREREEQRRREEERRQREREREREDD